MRGQHVGVVDRRVPPLLRERPDVLQARCVHQVYVVKPLPGDVLEYRGDDPARVHLLCPLFCVSYIGDHHPPVGGRYRL
jgi:hypothetical protein